MNQLTKTPQPETPDQTDATRYKQQARRLRDAMAEQGMTLTHGAALEMIARQNGVRDWNTLVARSRQEAPVAKPVMAVGAKACGRYLNQFFTGVIRSVSMMPTPGLFRLVVHFDAPVDVVTFDSFSSFRSRITAVVDEHGVSPRRTSDGVPHLVLDHLRKV